MSNSKNNSKPAHNSSDRENNKRHVYIDPGFKIDLVQDLRTEIKANNNQTTTHNNKQLLWSRVAAISAIVAAIFVGIQGILLRESNAINRDAIISVQRAYVSLDKILSERTAKGATHYWGMDIALQNSGTTPAINAAGIGGSGRRNSEPTDAEFRFRRNKPSFQENIAPRSTLYRSEKIYSEAEIFGRDLGNIVESVR